VFPKKAQPYFCPSSVTSEIFLNEKWVIIHQNRSIKTEDSCFCEDVPSKAMSGRDLANLIHVNFQIRED
jgi:hypothetical protein